MKRPARAGIPAYPRLERKRQDRPVTPEVAGSRPVAPAKVPANWPYQVSVQSRGSGECGYWVAAGVGGEGLAEVGEERLLAKPAGDRGGEEPFNGAFTAFGLTAE